MKNITMTGVACAHGGTLINGFSMSSVASVGVSLYGGRLCRRNLRKNKEGLKLFRLSCLDRTLQIRAEVKYVDPDEAKNLVKEEGYTILDVRDKTQYDRAHIKSCYHVPLFIENNDNDLGTVVKRTVHNNFSGLFFGLPFTKLNSEFVPVIQQQFPTDSKLLLICQEGLRSGIAARKLEEAGYANLAYITSGLQSVEPGKFEKEGSKELRDAGKAGLVTIQGKISAVLGAVLVAALVFITLFPDQAEKLLQMNSGMESNVQ